MNIGRLAGYLCLTTCIFGFKIDTAKAEDIPWLPANTEEQSQVRTIARAITVKVMTGNLWGSGIIVKQEGNTYTVLTNAHVARLGKKLQIQAPNGRVYPAILSQKQGIQGEDLAILTFKSSDRYRVANLVTSPRLSANSLVFAAGFPAKSRRFSGGDLVLTNGKIATFLPQSLKGGYQLGYTNDIYKGMSGGPLLTESGDVIAVNGKHKFPLWGNTYIFEDGSTPDTVSRRQMDYLSWGIPIASVYQLFPQVSPQKLKNPDLGIDISQNAPTFENVFAADFPQENPSYLENKKNYPFGGFNRPVKPQLSTQTRPRKAW